MRYGAANVKALYNVPNDGNQFTNGAQAIFDLGLEEHKFYCTPDFANDYPFQTSFGSTPTTCTEFLSTTVVAAELTRFKYNIITMFTFTNKAPDNSVINWWRDDPSNARFLNDFNEIKAAAVHLLTTYNNTGKEFIIQNWEGDWAYQDGAGGYNPVWREHMDRYAKFLSNRQAAVAAARAETPHFNVRVRHAIEVNRVLDVKDRPARTRILNTLANVVKPDMISYSAYDSTIDTSYVWGADQADWEAKVTVDFTRAIRLIKAAFPGTPWYVGEFGFPENETPVANDGRLMIRKIRDIALAEGAETLIYWEVFNNEPAIPSGYRGFWLIKPDGSNSVAGDAYAEFALGG